MRKASIWMSAVAVAALAAGCGGNGNKNNEANGAGTTGTSGTAEVNGGRTLTVRGCVEDGVPAGTYVLRANGPVQSGDATAGTSGSSGQGSSGTDVNGTRSGKSQQDAGVYRLIATGNLDFGQNLGKEVTVTGEIASQARDNTVGTTGPVGGKDKGDASSSGSSTNDRRQRQGTSGEGDMGTNLENGGSRGSGGGRVQGDLPDQTAGARFLRVTSMNKVADSCEGR